MRCGNLFLESLESVNENGRITGLTLRLEAEGIPQSHQCSVVNASVSDSVSPRQAGDLKRIERTVRFGDTQEVEYDHFLPVQCFAIQTVLAALGAPSKIFCKSDEKMLIQKGSSSENLKKDDRPDFFFNYFTLGLVSDVSGDCAQRG